MIIYNFNYYFPDNSGFSIRCKREIEDLSKKEEVIILCKKKINEKVEDLYKTREGKLIKIYRFLDNLNIIKKPKFYVPLIYELNKNFILFFNFFKIFKKIIKENKGKSIKVYSVVSPLTIPFIGYLIHKLYRVSLEVIEFHDLEPELAIHIKGLKEGNLIVRLEKYLEKFLCNKYKKIIVTTESQRNRISQRGNISKSKILSIPNIVSMENYTFKKDNSIRKKFGIKEEDYILGYVSSLSFDYTINGVIEIFENMDKIVKEIPPIKIVVVGDGDGLNKLKERARELKIEKRVIFTGRLKNVDKIISLFDAAIVPWPRDEMTETMLPTKIFEYMIAKKPILVPNFGELKKSITNMKSGLIYKSQKNLIENLLIIKTNKNLARRLGEEAYKRYLNLYNPKKLSKEYLNFLYKKDNKEIVLEEI